MNLTLLLEVIALILFALAALNIASDKVNLLAGGLFFWLLAIVLGGLKVG